MLSFLGKILLFIAGGVIFGLLLSAMLPHGIVVRSAPGFPPVVHKSPITTAAPWILILGGFALGAIGTIGWLRGKDAAALFGFAGGAISSGVTLLQTT